MGDEYYILFMDDDEDVDVEIVTLTDEEVEGEILDAYRRTRYRGYALIREVLCRLKRKGYLISEDRVRKILREMVLEEKLPRRALNI